MVHRYRTATQWGVYYVDVENERIVDVCAIDEDPAPAAIHHSLKDAIQHPLRIDRPYVRKGWLENRDRSGRGQDEFTGVFWDQALTLAGDEIRRVIDLHGNTSIFGGSYGWASAGRFHHAQSQLHRFLNLLGGCTQGLNTYSTAAAQVILPHVVAAWHQIELEQTTWNEIAANTELFVAFGGVPLRNTQVAYGGITEHLAPSSFATAVDAGVEFVNVSPQQSDMPHSAGARWIACRPSTDVALMLGIAHVLETEGLADRTFLASHCVGYDQFSNYILGRSDGQPKSPEWASNICGIPSGEIRDLARVMSKKRTFIACAWSLQRGDHGEQPYWMAVTLASMLGYIGLPGGGFGFGYGAEGFVGSDWRRFHWATFPKGPNPTGVAIPVARIADLLLHPGQTIPYDGREITFPQIELIYWAGGNPFHHHQDLNRLIEGWRNPATVIVNEPWWTPTAQWADIVFPATTPLEREDICASSHDPYAHAMQKAIPPQGEARSDHEIFKALASHLDIQDDFTEGRSEREWLEEMWNRSRQIADRQGFQMPTFESFWDAGVYKIPDRPIGGWLSDFREDPVANPLRTPSGKIEIFSQTIASFAYADCIGHPAWFEPFERLAGARSDRYPLHLLSPQPANRLHSQMDHSAFVQKDKIDGKEVIKMHPRAAAARGIAERDVVRVYNERGECLAGVELDDEMREDVVVLSTGAWFKRAGNSTLEVNGNPNVLTRDKGTSSLAQGPSAHTCLVEVEAFREAG